MDTEPPAPERRVAAMLDRLLGEGELIDSGAFSFDAVAAAEKLQKYRYRDRNAFLVPLIEGLLGLGARHVDVRSHGSDLEVVASPIEVSDPEQLLFGLFVHALGDPTDAEARALSRLAVAVDMAVGIDGMERVVLTHGAGGRRVSAEYRRGRAPAIVVGATTSQDALASDAGACEGGKLHMFIDRPWTEVFTLRGVHSEALTYLRSAVRFSKSVIQVDGVRLSGRPRDVDLIRHRDGGGLWSWVGFIDHREPSVIELWFGDTCVKRIPALGHGFYAVIELRETRRDLSQMTVIRDAELTKALEWVEYTRRGLLDELRANAESWAKEGKWPPTLPRARVESLLQPVGGVPSVRARWFTLDPTLDLGRCLAAASFYAVGLAVLTIDVGRGQLPDDAPARLNEYDGAVVVWFFGSMPLWAGAFLLAGEIFRHSKDAFRRVTRVGLALVVFGYVFAWLF